MNRSLKGPKLLGKTYKGGRVRADGGSTGGDRQGDRPEDSVNYGAVGERVEHQTN
jgi:hypothetical protein